MSVVYARGVLLSDDGGVIQVEPLTREWVEALADSDDRFTDCFGISVAPGWIGFAEMRLGLVGAATGEQGHDWGPNLVFDDDGALVGFAGWKGVPVAGAAELGYAVAPAHRGHGIATAVVRELVGRARAKGLARSGGAYPRGGVGIHSGAQAVRFQEGR